MSHIYDYYDVILIYRQRALDNPKLSYFIRTTKYNITFIEKIKKIYLSATDDFIRHLKHHNVNSDATNFESFLTNLCCYFDFQENGEVVSIIILFDTFIGANFV